MATGKSVQLTKQVGEYLVSAELCRRGQISTTFAGNVPAFDIVAVDQNQKATVVQVKTINKGDWQFDAREFLTFSREGKRQVVTGLVGLQTPNLPYVFVRLRGQNQDEFYVCRMRDVQTIVRDKYTAWLSAHQGIRPRNPESFHCSVSIQDLDRFRDNWKLITG